MTSREMGVAAERILSGQGLEKDTYTREELAGMLGVNVRAIDYYLYRSPTRGEDLVGVKVGQRVVFPRAEVIRFLGKFTGRKLNRVRNKRAWEDVG